MEQNSTLLYCRKILIGKKIPWDTRVIKFQSMIGILVSVSIFAAGEWTFWPFLNGVFDKIHITAITLVGSVIVFKIMQWLLRKFGPKSKSLKDVERLLLAEKLVSERDVYQGMIIRRIRKVYHLGLYLYEIEAANENTKIKFYAEPSSHQFNKRKHGQFEVSLGFYHE